MSDNTALRHIIGKTVASVRRQERRHAPSGKAVEYAIADGEELVSSTDPSSALIEFTDGTLLLLVATYDGELDAELVARDSPEALRILGAGEE